MGSLLVYAPEFVPDLLDGRLFSDWMAVPVINTQPTKWLRNIQIQIQSSTGLAHFFLLLIPCENVT